MFTQFVVVASPTPRPRPVLSIAAAAHQLRDVANRTTDPGLPHTAQHGVSPVRRRQPPRTQGRFGLKLQAASAVWPAEAGSELRDKRRIVRQDDLLLLDQRAA